MIDRMTMIEIDALQARITHLCARIEEVEWRVENLEAESQREESEEEAEAFRQFLYKLSKSLPIQPP